MQPGESARVEQVPTDGHVIDAEAPPHGGLAPPARQTQIDLRRPIYALVFSLAWPVLVQQGLVFSVMLSDRFLAGHFQPVPPLQQAQAASHEVIAVEILANPAFGFTTALAARAEWDAAQQIMARQVAYQAAQTTANYLSWFVTSYMVLVTVASTALVARFVGAGDQENAIRATNQSLVLAVIVGLVGTVVGLLGIDLLVWLLQLRGDAADFAADYLRPLFALLVFQVVEMAGIACLTGAGDTRPGLWVLGTVALLNLPLAWGFFTGWGPLPQLGFPGIALGTAVSHLIGCMLVLAILARGRAGLELRLRQLRPDPELLRRLLRIGVPAGLDSLSVAAGQLWFLSIVNRLGDVASSAHGMALMWEGLGYLSGAAFGTAAMALVGQNLGAGRPDRAAHSGWAAFRLGCLVMTLMGVVFFVLAPQMFLLFCPRPEQQPIVAAGVPVLRLVAFAMPPLACCIVFTYALRGAGDTRIPVLFTWVGFLAFRIPLAYLLTRGYVDLGPLGSFSPLFGAWLAMFADLFVRGAFFLVRFAGGRWKLARV